MNNHNLKIMVVAKDDDYSKRLSRIYPNDNIEIDWNSNINYVRKSLNVHAYDILLIVNSLHEGNMDNFDIMMDEIKTKHPLTQVLFLADPESAELAASALKLGVYQYSKLPVSNEELEQLIESAIERRPAVENGSPAISKSRQCKLDNLIGCSPQMQFVYSQIAQAAASNIPVLLLGETGTGKDLAAQAIHNLIKEQRGEYIPINLGALPSELVASELFGHEKGAFTGANAQHEGIFERANKGTVFLDEIESVDEKVQVSLLRLLEQKEFNRLGGKNTISTDARIIAASNVNLKDLVNEGLFRKDLYYRLDVFSITMPSLREIKEDIPILVQEFIARYNHQYNKKIQGISPDFLQLLLKYDWPGNIRELKNIIQRAVLICEGQQLLAEHLPTRFLLENSNQKDQVVQQSVSFKIGTPLKEVERNMILQSLLAADNNRKEAAKLLGISRRALYNKLHTYGIE